MSTYRFVNRRGFLRMSVGAAIGTAIAACQTAAPTPTTAPSAKATEPPTATQPARQVAASPTTAPSPSGATKHFESVENGFSFDYPAEWVTLSSALQLIVYDAYAVEDVLLGIPSEGPRLLMRPQVLPSEDGWKLDPSVEQQKTRDALGGSAFTLSLTSERLLDDAEKKLSGTDMTWTFVVEGNRYLSRQIQMRQGLNQFRVGYDMPYMDILRYTPALGVVLKSLKAKGLPSFVDVPWAEVGLSGSSY